MLGIFIAGVSLMFALTLAGLARLRHDHNQNEEETDNGWKYQLDDL